MAVTTVRQMLADVARPILVAAVTDPDLVQAERSVCADSIPVIDAVLADLNPQNVIPSTGRRNAAVSNLRDRQNALGVVDRVHPNFVPNRLYNAWNAIEEAAYFIELQIGESDVTF